MADTKLTALSAIGTLGDDDLFYVVDDPGGSPASAKATGATLKTYLGTGIRSYYIPAADFIPRITNGPAVVVRERTTNDHMFVLLAFDATTEEFATYEWRPPKDWDKGTLQLVFGWEHQATTTNFGVAWKFSAVVVSNDDATDAATGTDSTVTDDGGTTEDRYIASDTGFITAAGTPTEGDSVIITISRNPADAADTMAIDAELAWVRVLYSTNAINES